MPRSSLTAVRQVFGNGLRALVVPMPGVHRVVIDAHLSAGPCWESPAQNGISHFLEHMLYRGTKRLPSAHEQALAFEEKCGTLVAATYVDHGEMVVSAPPQSFDALLPLLGEVFREPLFTGIEVERGIVREEILELYDEDGQLVDGDDLVRAVVFGDHALGRPITGTAAQLSTFDVPALREHHRALYTSDATVVVVAGPVEPDATLAAIERSFAGLPRGEARPAAVPPEQVAAKFRHVRHASSQTELRLGFRAPEERHRDEPATELLLRVLDDGMSTRLYHEISDKRGLCYDVSAMYEAYGSAGVFDVSAESAHSAVGAVLDAALGVLADLRDHGPTAAELDKAKARFAWQIEEMADDADEVAAFFALEALLGRLRTPAERLGELCALAQHDVRAAAERMLTAHNLSVVTIGRVPLRTQRAIERRVELF